MNFKVALVLLLVFASTIATTTIVFNASTPVSVRALECQVSGEGSWVEPLGDPVDGNDFPH